MEWHCCYATKPGKGTRIPWQYELALVESVQKLRLLKLKAGKSSLVSAANFLIRGGTDLELAFKDHQVKYSWHYSFRKRWGIKIVLVSFRLQLIRPH